MMVSKRNHLFQGLLFRFHVKFQGCISQMKINSTTIWQLFFSLIRLYGQGDNTPTKKKRCFSTPRFSTPSQPSAVPSGCDFVTGVTGVVCVGSSGCDFVTGVTCVGSALDSAPTSGSETYEKHPVNLDLYK